jgi:hypothetical protein
VVWVGIRNLRIQADYLNPLSQSLPEQPSVIAAGYLPNTFRSIRQDSTRFEFVNRIAAGATLAS